MKVTRRLFLFMTSIFVVSGKALKSEVPRVENDDLLWGTYGISGKEPLKWKELRHCDTDHLQAILKTQSHIYEPYSQAILRLKAIQGILKARGAEVPEYDHDAYLKFVQRVTS